MNYDNIVLISLDTLRSDCITSISTGKFIKRYFSRKNFKTTALDRIIQKGIYFSNCISAAPYTTASHAAYFTGCWPIKNGVYEFFNRRIIKPTIFELANKAGYKTLFQTDFPLILGKHIGFKKRVLKYFVENEHKALDCLSGTINNSKTFSFFHFGGMHYPYGFHKLKFARSEYPKKVSELEDKFRIEKKRLSKYILDGTFRNTRDKKLLSRYKNIVDSLYLNKNYDDLNRLYIEGVDYFLKNRFNEFIEKVLSLVDDNNALLIIFSDHGEEWNNESKGHASSITDSVLRVPLIFYGKGIPKNKKISKLVRTIDLIPTICSVSSISCPPVDGRSIDILDPEKIDSHKIAFAQTWRNDDKLKIFFHEQKIIKNQKIIKPLATRLKKEAVYFKNLVLTREYSNNGILVKERFFKNNGVSLRPVDLKQRQVDYLRKLLKAYNNSRVVDKNKLDSVTKEIKKELTLLGYAV